MGFFDKMCQSIEPQFYNYQLQRIWYIVIEQLNPLICLRKIQFINDKFLLVLILRENLVEGNIGK